MKSYTYPAIFIKDQENDGYQVLFPDLEVTTKGEFIEEAFLYAKATLKAYFVYIEKYDLDFNMPTEYEKVKSACGQDDIVMLVDVDVNENDYDD